MEVISFSLDLTGFPSSQMGEYGSGYSPVGIGDLLGKDQLKVALMFACFGIEPNEFNLFTWDANNNALYGGSIVRLEEGLAFMSGFGSLGECNVIPLEKNGKTWRLGDATVSIVEIIETVNNSSISVPYVKVEETVIYRENGSCIATDEELENDDNKLYSVSFKIPFRFVDRNDRDHYARFAAAFKSGKLDMVLDYIGTPGGKRWATAQSVLYPWYLCDMNTPVLEFDVKSMSIVEESRTSEYGLQIDVDIDGAIPVTVSKPNDSGRRYCGQDITSIRFPIKSSVGEWYDDFYDSDFASIKAVKGVKLVISGFKHDKNGSRPDWQPNHSIKPGKAAFNQYPDFSSLVEAVNAGSLPAAQPSKSALPSAKNTVKDMSKDEVIEALASVVAS